MQFSLTDWITTLSTVVIMVWAGLQWHEMHTGGIDTHALAIAAGKQADAAKAQSDETKLQVEEMQESLKKTDKLIVQATAQAADTRNLAHDALIQAKATNDLANAANRSADLAEKQIVAMDRPWIGMDTMSSTVSFSQEPNSPIAANWFIRYKNYGTSTATDVRYHSRLIISSSSLAVMKQVILTSLTSMSLDGKGAAVFAGQELPNSGGMFVTQEMNKCVLDGQCSAILLGKVGYLDVFGKEHTSSFCRIWFPGKGLSGCGIEIGDSAD